MRLSILIYSTSIMMLFLACIISVITMKSAYMDSVEQSLDDSVLYAISLVESGRQNQDSEGNYDDYAETIRNFQSDSTYSSTAVTDADGTEADMEQFKKDFVDALVNNIDSRIQSLTVDIYGVDSVNGMISVKVTAEFYYPTGHTDTVSTYKTAIIDKYAKSST